MTWQPHYVWWSLMMVEARVERAEEDTRHTGWQLAKARNRLQVAQDKLARRGMSWRDIGRLKRIAGVDGSDV